MPVNLITNPGGEVDSTGWGTFTGCTMTRVNTEANTGTWSHEFDCSGAGVGEGASISTPNNLGFTTERRFGGWVYAMGEGTVEVYTRVVYTDVTVADGARATYTLTGEWVQLRALPVTSTAAKTVNRFQMFCRTKTAQTVTFYVDDALVYEIKRGDWRKMAPFQLRPIGG